MYQIINFDREEKYIKDFLKLPRLLYSKKEIAQNESEEKELLLGKHLLSKYFKLNKFLVYKDSKVAARCVITTYPNDSNAYIGFFECIYDEECAKTLFQAVKEFCKRGNYKKIIGPVDASFWLKYRMKINKFEDRPYVSEPYNKKYYLDLFSKNDYSISETYISNIYKKLPRNFEKEKIRRRYEEFIKKGYKIVSPKKMDYNKAICEIYKMIIELYSDFPIFKYLNEEDFLKIFGNYKYILDFSMVKLVYFKGETVAFFIGMPDYKNLLYRKFNLFTIINVLLKKIRSKNYVMLYMGVKKEHVGLGNAMTQTIINNLQKRRSTAIGAFIKEGKVTESYGKDTIEGKYKYVLLESSLQKH